MRAVGWARVGYGATLLVWPEIATWIIAPGDAGHGYDPVIRVLGVREAGQALVCAPRPTADVLRLSGGVDLVHAATMLALAARSTTWRRPALASMTVAAGFAALALSAAATSSDTDGTPLRPTTDGRARPLDRLLDLRDRWAGAVVDRAEDRSWFRATPHSRIR